MALIDQLIQRRDEQRRQLEGELAVAKRSGRQALLPSERAAIDQLEAITTHINQLRDDGARKGDPTSLRSRVNQPGKKTMDTTLWPNLSLAVISPKVNDYQQLSRIFPDTAQAQVNGHYGG